MSVHPEQREPLQPAGTMPVREVAVVMLVAALLLAVANSQGLLTWARALPEQPGAEILRLVIYSWHIMMERSGIPEIFQAVRDTFRFLKGF